MDAKQQMKNIHNVVNSIPFHKSTILVGNNGSGKSVVRKYLEVDIKRLTKYNKAQTKSISMQTRTEDPSGFGLMKDLPWEPTSLHTYTLIDELFRSCFENEENSKKKKIPYYYIIDELEIGLSRESQLAVCNYIKEKIPQINEKSYGLLIITHSEFVVEQLKDVCDFIDLNDPNRTADEWINREIIPTDFEQFKIDSHELFVELTPNKN